MKRIFVLLCVMFVGVAFAETSNVYWYNDDNSVYQTTTCTVGGDITLPAAPTKPGYTFVGWEKFRLPRAYTELEYIESTGTQYIDTGIQQGTASSYATELVYKFTVDNYRTSLCGVRVDNYNGWGQPYTINDQTGIWCGNPNAQISPMLTTALNTVYTDKFEVDVTNGTFVRTRNGETSTNSGITFTPAYPGNVYLFGYNPGTAGVGQPASVVMYSTKIWKDGVLVRNFIPAKRQSDNAVGMYDRVTKTFFTNAGTGDFIAGPAVQ